MSGSLVPLAMSRRRRALAAYAPLAMKVFGSAHISLDLKLWMFQTLVMSRLTFNLHVVVPTKRFITTLNDAYLRGMRRAAYMTWCARAPGLREMLRSGC